MRTRAQQAYLVLPTRRRPVPKGGPRRRQRAPGPLRTFPLRLPGGLRRKAGGPVTISGRYLASGGWQIIGAPCAPWGRDAAAPPVAPAPEVERVVVISRRLLLEPQARLTQAEMEWLLASSRRAGCLMEFLAAGESIAELLCAPFEVTFSPEGRVSWSISLVG